MGWNVRRSRKIAPGIRLNLSNRGIGFSVGPRHAKISVSPTGRVTQNIGIPGTGVRYTKVLSNKRRTRNSGPTYVSTRHPVPFIGYVLVAVIYSCVSGIFAKDNIYSSNSMSPNNWHARLILIGISLISVAGFVSVVRSRWMWNKAAMTQNQELENGSN